jgi:hypothetical protein
MYTIDGTSTGSGYTEVPGTQFKEQSDFLPLLYYKLIDCRIHGVM